METLLSRASRVYRITRTVHGVYVVPLNAGFDFLNIRILVTYGVRTVAI